MKKYIIISASLFFLLIGYIADAQTSASGINDSTAAWRVNFITDNGSGGTLFTHDKYRYTFDGDTLINELVYNKLFKGGHYYEEDFFGGESYNHRYYSHEYVGAIRVSAGKWYFYGSSDFLPEQEYLLYDFTLNAGDPLPFTFNNPGEGLTIAAIDTVLINTIERRRFQLAGQMSPAATYIIEGLGSDVGLIEPLEQFEYIWQLVCYAEDGVPYWPESGIECDLNVNSPSVTASRDFEIQVTPNPFKSIALLKFPEIQQPGLLQVTDMPGNILLQYELTRGQKEMEIQPGLKAGIYLLRISTEDKILSRKIVVQ
ncbi:MAG: T9SS type A sorting domain-containing protein [Lentimicrobium sp.]|nr:T9SS type A sorting domain-containing protein [Lentimicrobium sp.]